MALAPFTFLPLSNPRPPSHLGGFDRLAIQTPRRGMFVLLLFALTRARNVSWMRDPSPSRFQVRK